WGISRKAGDHPSTSLRGAKRRSTPSSFMWRDGLLRFARNDGGWAITMSSLPQPFRRALLRKRLRPLDVILRGRHRLHRRVVALFGDRLFQRDRQALLDRLLGGADRHRRVLADGLGPALGRRQRAAGRHHLVDEAELEALPGRNM